MLKSLLPISLIFIMIISLNGCSTPEETAAVRSAADNNMIEGIDKNSEFFYTLPLPHSGPFSEVKQLNIQVNHGDGVKKDATAILGKKRSTDKWVVIDMFENTSNGWEKL